MSDKIWTMEHFKNEVAQSKGYPNWDEYENWIIEVNQSVGCAQLLVGAMEEVANLYASQFKKQVDPEEAYVAGYKKRAEQSGLLYDFASELHSRSYYIKFKSEQLKQK
jgi:hypothetical protein